MGIYSLILWEYFLLYCETTFPQYMELSSLLILRPPHKALLSDNLLHGTH